ncbi:hypothetical protein ACFQE1_03655 [Halobium palmae]|uniref:DNA primase/polymerase bifunctional N-terminal domain-containing protein n=1 Tax=Halobium palmae TaxID=1776492 RepID=A0ABD5RWU8_9EURY
MTGDSEDRLPERVQEYIDRHPDASLPAILGKFDISPDDVASVKELLGGEASTDESASSVDNTEKEEKTPEGTVAESTGKPFHPDALLERDWWVAWILDDVGRKRPVAPWLTGHGYPATWKAELSDDERPETDYETVAKWVSLPPEAQAEYPTPDDAQSDWMDVGLILPRDRPEIAERITLIDWDDVRDPETGEIHPIVQEFLEKYGGYAELSQSGEGIHVFVYGGLPGTAKKYIRHIDGEPFVGDDLPMVEIYDGGRHVAMTGRHVDGTDDDVLPFGDPDDPDDRGGQALINELCERFVDRGNSSTDVPTNPLEGASPSDGSGPEAMSGSRESLSTDEVAALLEEAEDREYAGPDPDDWDVPDDRNLAYHAAVEAHYHGFAHENFWRVTSAVAAHGAALGKSVDEILTDLRGDDREGTSAGWGGKTTERVRYDHGRAEAGEFAPPSLPKLASWGILPASEAEQKTARPQPETCAPPSENAEPLNVEAERERMMNERYQRFVDGGRLTVWRDPPGVGKTTTGALAAAGRDRPFSLLHDKHAKAAEVKRDDVMPGFDHHLRGGEQPRETECMDAVAEGETCTEHGDIRNCPRMCPVYDLGTDHPIREQYEALVGELGPVETHLLWHSAAEDGRREHLPGHDENGSCAWLEQFAEAEAAERLLGVHNYATLKTVKQTDSAPRDVLLDESADLMNTTSVEPRRLRSFVRALNDALENGHFDQQTTETIDDLARFTDDVLHVVAGADNSTLTDLEPPEERMGEETIREVNGEVKRRSAPETPQQYAERFAHAKAVYGERTQKAIREGSWTGEPLAFDELLAAAIEAGAPDPLASAIAPPDTLANCPRCGTATSAMNGARGCEECGWHEAENNILGDDAPRQTTLTFVERDEREGVPDSERKEPTLTVLSLPSTGDIPDPGRTLALDATASPERIAGTFGVSPNEISVEGDATPPFPDSVSVTQVLDGQYHAGTIRDSTAAQERIQTFLDEYGDRYDHPLLVTKGDLVGLFDVPDNVRVVRYHAQRGLNMNECDAVTCLGAPHPDMDDLQRQAELLVRNAPDETLRVGGEEHSTRRGAPNPPVYRKLRYTDENGEGRAVPTKHYTGVTGALFREARERELEQAVHRIRPLLDEDGEEKDVFLLTNVPTDLPVDHAVDFEELTDSLGELFGVPDGALDLLEALDRVDRGEGPDGFRASSLVRTDSEGTYVLDKDGFHRLARLSGLDVTRRTVSTWVNDLADLGLLSPGEYEQRGGVPYAAERATWKRALSVLSYNGGFQVAISRRIRALAANGDGSIEWLRLALDLLPVEDDASGGPLGSEGAGTTP